MWLLWLGRMRVLGCGVSSPPDKRQFSSVNSIRNTIANGKPVCAENDSPAEIFLESAGDSDRIVKDSGFLQSLRTEYDCTTITVSSGTSSISRERRKFFRSTCFTFDNSRQQSYNYTLRKARYLSFGR